MLAKVLYIKHPQCNVETPDESARRNLRNTLVGKYIDALRLDTCQNIYVFYFNLPKGYVTKFYFMRDELEFPIISGGCL